MLSSFLKAGGASGAALGFLFALAVVSLADCAGPGCTRERVLGVAGHAVGGALIGLLLGGAAYALWCLGRRVRPPGRGGPRRGPGAGPRHEDSRS